MAYADDAVKAKLSALNETQESIVSVAQWVMFHRRHADRTAAIWLSRLKESGSNKRLNLIYLANEVAQQSKARRRDEFLVAFSPIIVEATSSAYRGATSEVQSKLRRVVEVWRSRQIFDVPVQDALEAKIEELDKSRSSSKRPALGGSLFSSSQESAPPELKDLVTNQVALSKATASAASAIPAAEAEYSKLTDPEKAIPTPPVYAARLSALLKSLSAAESAVSDSLKARRALIATLETLLEENKSKVPGEESQYASLSERKNAIDAKKREVEDSIMRGFSAENSPVTPFHGDPRLNGRTSATPVADPDRPDVEELTPPPEAVATTETVMGVLNEEYYEPMQGSRTPIQIPSGPLLPAPNAESGNGARSNGGGGGGSGGAGADLLNSLNLPPVRQYSGSSPASNKRRKIDDESAVFEGDAMADLDDDVAELLKQESGGR